MACYRETFTFTFATFQVIAVVFEINTAIVTDVSREHDASIFRVKQYKKTVCVENLQVYQ
jgi:hypothetical protein